jgi:type II secretory pathway pseudopilin PulG
MRKGNNSMKLRNVLNEKGFSLVQVMVGLGLAGVLSMAIMTQLSNSQQEQSRFGKKLELDLFMDNVARQFSSKRVCDINFAGGPINQTPAKLDSNRDNDNDGIYEPIIEVGKKYLGDRISVDSMSLSKVNDSQAMLSIIFKKERTKGSTYNIIKKNLILAADHDGTTIKTCYYNLNIVSEDFLDDMGQKVCKGVGVEVDSDGKCNFKSFDQTNLSSLNCDDGYAINSLTYNPFTQGNPASYQYEATCEKILTKDTITCANNQVRSVGSDGLMTCLKVSSLINGETVSVTNGKECKIDMVTGKLKLICSAGTTSGGPSCVPQGCSSIQNTYGPTIEVGCSESFDDCGNSCVVTGACTTGSNCDSCTQNGGGNMGNYKCLSSGWGQYQAAVCNTPLDNKCTNSSANATLNQSICCTGTPAASCGGSTTNYCGTVFRCHLGKKSAAKCIVGGGHETIQHPQHDPACVGVETSHASAQCANIPSCQ